MKRIVLILSCLLLAAPAALWALSGEEILRRADERQTFETSRSSGELRITDRFGEKVTTFKAWSQGADKSLIEFTSAAERGQKILRTEDALYLYYPDASEVIRMQGAALRQSMLGSDISYEDMTGGKERIQQYEVELDGEETVRGNECYVLNLEATTRTVPYPQEKLWVGKEHFIIWKGEYATSSGRLLKVIETLETGTFDGQVAATTTRIEDVMKADSHTLMVLDELEIDVSLPDSLFSLQELSW